jgi:hypothetical protein
MATNAPHASFRLPGVSAPVSAFKQKNASRTVFILEAFSLAAIRTN